MSDNIQSCDKCPHRVHGKWIEQEEPFGHYNEVWVACCSKCGESYVLGEMGIDDVRREFHYCPNCGALMDEGE
jgi:ribosomal protein S27AE